MGDAPQDLSRGRRHKRHQRRCLVEFGETDFLESGVTDDISAGGIFILAPRLPAIGVRLHLRLYQSPTQWRCFEVEVRRHRHGGPDRQGFGVRFLFPATVIAEALGVVPQIVSVHFSTVGALQASYDAQLRLGHLRLPADVSASAEPEAVLELHLDFAGKVVRFDATLAPVVDSAPPQVHLAIRDVAMLNGTLAALLPAKPE